MAATTPPRTRRPAAKKTAARRPAPQKADDYAAEANPPEKPAGSPELLAPIDVPRRRRAEMLRALGALGKRSVELGVIAEDLSEPDKELDFDDFAAAAGLLDLVADIEETLAVCAADPDAFAEWAKRADEGDLLALFSWYTAQFAPGEASASST